MKNFWNHRTSVFGRSYDFLLSSNPACPFIIRLGFNGACFVYDTRENQDLFKTDFQYFGYSLVSSHLHQAHAKKKINKLMKEIYQ